MLEDTTLEELQKKLKQAEEKREIQKLTVAINYSAGFSIKQIAQWYGLSEKTVESFALRGRRQQ